jgi:DNA-binding NarL/FixJ family response regulator
MYNAYIEKLQELKNAIQRKLRFKKYEEVNDVLDTINLKKEREALYTSFDSIFLKLFPHFVQEFNSLFPEEEKMDVSGNEMLLNTELRIFALIRMGVNDHEQIARILEYSVRTIYNYKTKVKNKSIYSNEDFEQRVLGIKAF